MAKSKRVLVQHLRSRGTYWVSIGVTLRSRGGQVLHTPPERALVASPRHTFADLALAIDDAFGRWELGRLREFVLEDGTRIGEVVGDRRRSEVLDYRRIRLQRLEGGASFTYTVEEGESWTHACVLVGAIDPDEVVFDRPGHPVVYQSVGRSPALTGVDGTRIDS